MAQAEKVDAAVKAGEPVGALAGVPVGIKDVLADARRGDDCGVEDSGGVPAAV